MPIESPKWKDSSPSEAESSQILIRSSRRKLSASS